MFIIAFGALMMVYEMLIIGLKTLMMDYRNVYNNI